MLSEETPRERIMKVDGFELKVFKTSFRFPPLMGFGNDHSLGVLRELDHDKPDLVHFHNYYLWNFPYVAPWVKRKRIPLVSQFHGTDPIRRLKALMFYPSLRLCDRLLVPTQNEEDFLTHRLGFPSSRVRRVPSTGVDTNRFYRSRPLDNEPVILYAGRIPKPTSHNWEKAPHLLLPILRALLMKGSGARLLIAGDGPGLSLMKDQADKLNLGDSVEFLGQLDQEALPALYSRSRLTFVPMQMDDIEPFWGGTVQESLACGTPVVAFNNRLPGFRRFGLLVSTNPKQAAHLIASALANPELLSTALSQGPLAARRDCDWEALTRRLEAIYEEVAH